MVPFPPPPLSLQQWPRPLPISTSLPPAIFPLRREAAQIDSLSSLRFRSQTKEKKKKDSSFLHELSACRPTGKRQRPTFTELKRNQMLPISIPFATRFVNLVSSPRKELLVGESFPLYLPSLLCTQGSERGKEEEKEEGAAFQLPSFPPHSNCLPPPPLLFRPPPPPFLPPPRTPLMEFLHPPPQKERENGTLWSLRFSSRLFIRQISSSALGGELSVAGR